jgi:hypothetical protein
MADLHIHTSEIETKISQMRIHEQDMLNDLYQLFDRPAPRAKMSRILRTLFELICRTQEGKNLMIEIMSLEEPSRELLIKNNTSYFGYGYITNLDNIIVSLQHSDSAYYSYSAKDIATLMRAVGTWLERGLIYNRDFLRDNDRIFRENTPRENGINVKTDKYYGKNLNNQWRDEHFGPQYRERLKFNSPERGIIAAKKWEIADDIPLIRLDKFDLGTEIYQVCKNDLTRKIDLLLGLEKGAGISGTTADFISAMKLYSMLINNNNLNNDYYLFPVTTIAAIHHHTLLEVGLVLSRNLNNIINYSPGFFSTLNPRQDRGDDTNNPLPFNNILKSYEEEKDKRKEEKKNHHILIWYETEKKPKGCIEWTEENELKELKANLTSLNLIKFVERMGMVPKGVDVLRLLKEYAPNLLNSKITNIDRPKTVGEYLWSQ